MFIYTRWEKSMLTCTICSESFNTVEEYLNHMLGHKVVESKEISVSRTCKTCSVTSTFFDKYKRICRSCVNNNLHRCTSCNKVKHASAFHKNNTSGRCAACKRRSWPTAALETSEKSSVDVEIRKQGGLSMLSDEAKEDIKKMLAEIQEYYDSNGECGKKHKFIEICRKHDIKESTLQYWMRKGIFQRPTRLSEAEQSDSSE